MSQLSDPVEIAQQFLERHPEKASVQSCLEDILMLLHVTGHDMKSAVENACENRTK
jgi:hypothetical protein